ncbi:MAG: fumarate hydratase [Candidatus Methanomethylicota archaeon]|uniref:Fumarate hydratase n=1 Tax=Thermoproteota archaeon TaxID=2056631 RepID=A0A497F2T0_9CREN|nr:MAG: fumarate hydratase [Candidatus Verstraetearchaeota archaeon]
MIYEVSTPIDENFVRKLKVGDLVYISGVVFTLRDRAHSKLVEMIRKGEEPPFDLYGGVIYHCGPLAVKRNDKWDIVSAGPTTSMRMEIFEGDVIRRLKPRLIIGKGGMGENTLKTLIEVGAAYLAYPGGAGVLAASAVKKVLNVFWLDLGVPEAVWVLEVEKFGPCVVAMDSHGKSLYKRGYST